MLVQDSCLAQASVIPETDAAVVDRASDRRERCQHLRPARDSKPGNFCVGPLIGAMLPTAGANTLRRWPRFLWRPGPPSSLPSTVRAITRRFALRTESIGCRSSGRGKDRAFTERGAR